MCWVMQLTIVEKLSGYRWSGAKKSSQLVGVNKESLFGGKGFKQLGFDGRLWEVEAVKTTF